ncbi:hypothetical protein EW145_g2485 [Phellinidium pouzarii]|uniref:Protein kinase domain-containing protein n=1 Tax=Phellinidium pouzarii TaxID=167371 RepID=A0A4S4LC65_9AGAM|nr:hypothetical protein EW145_g2485 [Phellinidium pouzarii]
MDVVLAATSIASIIASVGDMASFPPTVLLQVSTTCDETSYRLEAAAIESSLGDYQDLLDEAERSFQIASLVEIHYTVGILQQRSIGVDVSFVENVAEDDLVDEIPFSAPLSEPSNKAVACQTITGDKASLTLTNISLVQSSQSVSASEQMPAVKSSLAEESNDDFELEEELLELDSLGFRSYHQSDVRLQSTLKSMGPNSFWEDSSIAVADGRQAIVKRYDSRKDKEMVIKKWLHDIKTPGNLYHANLPQLVGYSDRKSPTPFILLSQNLCCFLYEAHYIT